MKNATYRLSTYIGWFTALLTLITFSIALCTPPISGPFCQSDCIEYPYLDILSRFPRDYIWMYPAIVLTLLYVAFTATIYNYAADDKKIFAIMGLAFAVLSAGLIVAGYFTQITVIQPSLLKGETSGISLLTQYNPHGIFIALEEIGYLVMNLSFFCAAPVFLWNNKSERTIKLVFLSGFPLSLILFLVVTIFYGADRGYIFEIMVISVAWLELIMAGFQMAKLFRKRMAVA